MTNAARNISEDTDTGGDTPPPRRPSAQSELFQPRPTPNRDADVVLDRKVLRSSAGEANPQTQRRREMVGDLPEWEPLPPGETFLTRPGRSE